MKVFLGIDTSCYTTSVALMLSDGTLLADARTILSVKSGGRGLAQSEMVYQHTRNLPHVFADAFVKIGSDFDLAAVGVSTKPRPREDSYMPAFLTGEGYAKVLALCHGVDLFELSHQENHIYAGIWSAGGPCAGRFIAVHVSGGTTEITLVEAVDNKLAITLLGGSRDISAGQFLDRVGVTIGLPFPAGPQFELLAARGRENAVKIPAAIKEMTLSFSGPETHARRLLDKGIEPESIAAGVEECIAVSLAGIVSKAISDYDIDQILFVGGVTANNYIRHRMSAFLNRDRKVKIFFPNNKYSSDNAVGAAYFALKEKTEKF